MKGTIVFGQDYSKPGQISIKVFEDDEHKKRIKSAIVEMDYEEVDSFIESLKKWVAYAKECENK